MALKKVGVQLTAENASQFISQMNAANSASQSLGVTLTTAAKGANELSKAAQSVKVENLTDRIGLMKKQLDAAKQSLNDMAGASNVTNKAFEAKKASVDRLEVSLKGAERRLELYNRQLAQVDDNANKATQANIRLDMSMATSTSTSSRLTSVFDNFGNKAIGGLASGLTGLVGGFMAVDSVVRQAIDGWNIASTIESNRAAINALIGGVEEGNAAWEQATHFARQYGFTQEEISGTLALAAPIIRKYNSDTSETIGVLSRMALIDPVQGLEGAAVAMRELAGGDISSLVRRFEVSRDRANEMKDAIAAGADPVALMNEYLLEMNVTTESLSSRMEGLNGANNTLRQGVEDVKLAFVDFLQAAGVDEWLVDVGEGMSVLGGYIREITTLMPLFIDQFGPQLKAAFESALWPVLALVEGIGTLTTFIQSQNSAVEIAKQQQSALQNTLVGVADKYMSLSKAAEMAAGMSDHNARAVESLRDQYESNRITQDEYEQAIYKLLGTTEASIGATDQSTSATEANSDANLNNADALGEAEQATIDDFFAKLEQADAAELAAQQNEVLDSVLMGLTDGTLGASDAMDILTSTFGISGNAATELFFKLQGVAAQLAVVMRLLGKPALAVGASMVNIGGDLIGNMASAGTFSPRSSRVKKGKKGRAGGGKSEAEKEAEKARKAVEKEAKEEQKAREKRQEMIENYQEDVQEATEEHLEKVAEIEQRYREKSLADEKKFNSDKFSDQANFWNTVADNINEQTPELLAREQALWDESQKIAQSGRAAEAQAYYEEGLKILQLQAERNAKIMELEKELSNASTEEERKRLQQQIDLRQRANEQLTEQENARLETIRESEGEAQAERNEALTEEQAEYQESLGAIREKFVEALDKADERIGQTADAMIAWADQTINLFATVAGAAASAQAAISGFTNSEGGNPPEQRRYGGPVRRGGIYTTVEDGRFEVYQSNSGKVSVLTGHNALYSPPEDGRILSHPESVRMLQSAQERVFMPRSMDDTQRSINNDMLATMASNGGTQYNGHTFNYEPHYASPAPNPSVDFAMMQARANV